MKKEDLRKIEYKFDTRSSKEPQKAFFHLWNKRKHEDGSEYTIAVIELENGKVEEADLDQIKFID